MATTHAPPLQPYWDWLDTRFAAAEAIFNDCMTDALAVLSPDDMVAYLDAARLIGKLGRGVEPLLAFLEQWPAVAVALHDPASRAAALSATLAAIQVMQKSPNGRAILPFLQTLAPVTQRLGALPLFKAYLDLALDFMAQTTGSIHGHHTTFPSPGLPDFFTQAPRLLSQLALDGLRNWVTYGIRNYHHHPERQKDFFSLQSADSLAVMQRERHGTLLVDRERILDLYLRGLWHDQEHLIPYTTAFDTLRKPIPYYDKLGIHLPDVLDHHCINGQLITALDRYRAILAHIVGHRRYSLPQIADNWSPFQRMAVECFEDCRIDTLLIREYPGIARLFLSLHPKPIEAACDPETTACLRHRLAMLSRALLDSAHGYIDADLNDFVRRFHAVMAEGVSSTREIAELALSYVAKTRRQSDQFARVHFDDTVVEYRDDNRQLWQFIEPDEEDEAFDEPRKIEPSTEITGLPPRHYPEWDYHSQSYRPDWVSLYESLHPSGNAADLDQLLQKHAGLAKQLKQLLDRLKPQDKVRIRYQEDGSELDLDVAIRALIDFKSGAQPDPRINMSHQTNGRSIAVMLLLDLSESLNEPVAGGAQTILELSQEAVALLAFAIDQLGDPFAIAGFHSNTRHEVRYLHIKGYTEGWTDEVKGRLAAMSAGYSTRMGPAIRHAAHYLANQKADKKLMLILTDGKPADIDVPDERLLIEDARQAVFELGAQNIYPYCISLDARVSSGDEDYVRHIFGTQHTIVDRIERLPEQLPKLFMTLTR